MHPEIKSDETAAVSYTHLSVTMIVMGKKASREKVTHGKIQIFRNLISLATPLTINRILLSVLQSAEALLIPIQLREMCIRDRPDFCSFAFAMTSFTEENS